MTNEAALTNEEWFKRVTIARDSTIPEEITSLADSDDFLILGILAKNVNTPAEVLTKLAEDGHDNIRYRVLQNPNTPEAVKLWLKMGGYAGLTLAEFIKATQQGTE
jgi:hypothetical protein